MLDEHQRRQDAERHEQPGHRVTAHDREPRHVEKARNAQHEDEGRREPELPEQQLTEELRRPRDMEVAGAAALLEEARPMMIRIPQDDGQEQHDGDGEAEPGAGVPEQPASACRQKHRPEADAGQQQHRRILAVECQAREDAGRRPPPAGTACDDPRHGPERRDPEQDQRRVRRHQDAARAEEERRIQQQRRRIAAARAEASRRVEYQDRPESGGDRCEQADAEGAVTKQAGAEADPQRHHEGMVEVSRRQRP